uniref:Uncharacterized protein n=1 Tax=Aegilops tauschii subsp. strangulata TaxID=200361 RepID=A0A453CAN6_AEGTS
HSNNSTTTTPKASRHGDSSLANRRGDGTAAGLAGRALLGARGPPPRAGSSAEPRSPSWPSCPRAERSSSPRSCPVAEPPPSPPRSCPVAEPPPSPPRSGPVAEPPPPPPCSGPVAEPPPPSPPSGPVAEPPPPSPRSGPVAEPPPSSPSSGAFADPPPCCGPVADPPHRRRRAGHCYNHGCRRAAQGTKPAPPRPPRYSTGAGSPPPPSPSPSSSSPCSGALSVLVGIRPQPYRAAWQRTSYSGGSRAHSALPCAVTTSSRARPSAWSGKLLFPSRRLRRSWSARRGRRVRCFVASLGDRPVSFVIRCACAVVGCCNRSMSALLNYQCKW